MTIHTQTRIDLPKGGSVCMYLYVCIYKITHSRAIRPCHPGHSMPLVCVFPRRFDRKRLGRGRGYDDSVPGNHQNSPCRELVSNSTHFTSGLVKYVPGRGNFRAVPSQDGDNFVTFPPPPQSLNDLERRTWRRRREPFVTASGSCLLTSGVRDTTPTTLTSLR